MLIERLILGRLGTNSYIISDSDTMESAVIDPADSCSKILSRAREIGANIKYIIITHAHCDHIGALDELKANTNAAVCIGEADNSDLNDNTLSLCNIFGTESPKTKADIILRDNDELKLGEATLKIIHTPGHTKGGICIYTPGILISGDTLFAESVGRTDFPGGSMSELVHSIKDKLFCLPDDTKVYPGHGESTSIGHEKINNPFV